MENDVRLDLDPNILKTALGNLKYQKNILNMLFANYDVETTNLLRGANMMTNIAALIAGMKI